MKVKVCPVCKTLNPIRRQHCQAIDCGANLMNAEITEATEEEPDSGQDMKAKNETEEDTPKKLEVFRICPDCGHHVFPNTWICDECGCKLYGVPLTEEKNRPQEQTEQVQRPAEYMLRSEDGRFCIRIPEGESIIIGREAVGAEYLASKYYVGRKHLKIQADDGWIRLTDLLSTNGSLVNGRSVKTATPYKLSENDLISLGAREGQSLVENAAYFRLLRMVKK